MRGLIYKDITIFFKGIDKKLVLIAAGAIILLMVNTGVYAGLFASVMLAMTIGIQNIMSFASDDSICTLAVSLAGSVLFNLLSSVAFRSFNITVWGVSTAASVIVPLLWTGICLPLTYWFGFHSAQTMGMIVVIPMFYFVKYFEDGAGFSAMTNSILSYVVVAGIAVVVLFIISMIISMAGYNRKE